MPNRFRVAEPKVCLFILPMGPDRKTFRAAHTEQAHIAAVAMGNPHATEKTVALLRQHYPHLKIFARAQDITHIGPLSRSGADAAIPEVLETGLRLSDHVLAACDIPQEDIDIEIAKFRRADMLLMNELAPRTARQKTEDQAQKNCQTGKIQEKHLKHKDPHHENGGLSFRLPE